MPVRPVRLVLLALVALLVAPAATVSAAPRLQIGFYDDPSFRWSGSVQQNLASARAAGGSIVHTTAEWSQIAPTRPRVPLDPDDKAYRLSDLDALVRDSARYGQQVMINISGAPRWANGGKPSNHAPTSLSSLTTFARMLATRYSGKNPGLGSVSKWSVWNEPNLDLFLTPQFSGTKIVSPGIYAKIYDAAYKGIKVGNPLAKVAVGETSNRGRDKPLKGVSGSVAPATFARLLAQATPKIRFDAWATHPYPTYPSIGPTQKVAWPNVTMTRLQQPGAELLEPGCSPGTSAASRSGSPSTASRRGPRRAESRMRSRRRTRASRCGWPPRTRTWRCSAGSSSATATTRRGGAASCRRAVRGSRLSGRSRRLRGCSTG